MVINTALSVTGLVLGATTSEVCMAGLTYMSNVSCKKMYQ